VEAFGAEPGWTAQAAADGSFEVRFQGQALGVVRWDLLGEHNRNNALAALAAARHAGVPVAAGIEGLTRFRNVKRRLEVRGSVHGITVYDDFAHHPTAIETTLAGLRSKVGGSRILAVLEPRSNTMKLGVMKESLAPSLVAADLVFCYTGGIGWDAAGALATLGAKAVCHDDLAGLVRAIVTSARPGDHVLVMSNGAFGDIHDALLRALSPPP
jgi:UDP-N-acetylmuramate: L-alanyl-gamma-D-glutamyl-meso-diaminopimelate ligase